MLLTTTSKLQLPTTEGIKYAGSKRKILPRIAEILSDLSVHRVLDGFSGTTRVSQLFAQLGYQTTANDMSDWSQVFGECYLLNQRNPTHYLPIIAHLNGLEGCDGWFTEHYGGDVGGSEKRPFQRKNTQKLDAIRDEIDRMNLDSTEKAVALTSLIRALDEVDSTLGHHASYLADWSPRSHKDLVLKLPNVVKHEQQNTVIKGDIFEAVREKRFDLAYFDPPYGSNNDKMPSSRVRYKSYYHIWTSVVRNDKPALFGKVGRRNDSRDRTSPSVFEDFRKDTDGHFVALQAIERLIEVTDARYILLSYSSGGRATKEALCDMFNRSGTLLQVVEIDYTKNVMGAMRWTNEWVNSDGKCHEFLFLMEK